MDGKFGTVDKRFEQVDREFDALRQLIKSEGETTRRHFDVVAEKMAGEQTWRSTVRWQPRSHLPG